MGLRNAPSARELRYKSVKHAYNTAIGYVYFSSGSQILKNAILFCDLIQNTFNQTHPNTEETKMYAKFSVQRRASFFLNFAKKEFKLLFLLKLQT